LLTKVIHCKGIMSQYSTPDMRAKEKEISIVPPNFLENIGDD